MHQTRRSFIRSAAAAPLAKRKAVRPPNIVFIMGDDLGYSDLGCYGQRKIHTPYVDGLAAQGMRFTDAYAGCTVCAPSRSVLMTGLHGGHTTVRSNPGGVPLRAEDVTIAQVLKTAGYATGGFGKWGLGDVGTTGVPSRHGFDEFFGYLHQVHAHFYYPRILYENEKPYPLPGNQNGGRGTYSHDVIAQKALDFIYRHKDRPFFCYMPVTIPHLELLVPEDSLAQYRGRFPEQPFMGGHYAAQEAPHAAYAAMITRLDRDVGRVLALLRSLGLEQDTLVIFTSDNGAATRLMGGDFFGSYGPFRGNKENLYEGGIRVPFLARWPGRIAQGAVSGHPFASYDLMATFAEIAGARMPGPGDGISISAALTGGKQKAHEYLYWELPTYHDRTAEFAKETPMQAVRMGEWKAVRPKPDGQLELYNLKSDIGETRNLAAERPDVLGRIERFLRTARTEPLPQRQPPETWNIGG